MDDPITEMASKPMFRQTMGGSECPTADSVVLASTTGNEAPNLVLVSPPEASIVVIQKIFRGLQTRRKYDLLKVWEAELHLHIPECQRLLLVDHPNKWQKFVRETSIRNLDDQSFT